LEILTRCWAIRYPLGNRGLLEATGVVVITAQPRPIDSTSRPPQVGRDFASGGFRFGPAILGRNVCYHGGNASQVNAKALRRLQSAAAALVQKLLRTALDGDAPDHVAIGDSGALDRAGTPAKAKVSVAVKPWEPLMGRYRRYRHQSSTFQRRMRQWQLHQLRPARDVAALSF
jgi:hypothetical protein